MLSAYGVRIVFTMVALGTIPFVFDGETIYPGRTDIVTGCLFTFIFYLDGPCQL
eukprot:XP_001707421.1 Hypothetical protein GL50803_115157 [Giardia lamblia ATCC 50803]